MLAQLTTNMAANVVSPANDFSSLAPRRIFLGLIRTPPEQRDLAAMAKAQAEAEMAFTLLDAHLSDRRFVTGETCTIADIPLGIATYRWCALDISRPTLPNVERWHRLLQERPAYQQYVVQPLT